MKQFWPQFLAIVAQHPDAPAIIDGGVTVTYQQLAADAAGLGENLIKKGVTFETPVAIEMEKSASYIAALLGCWYAGAAFVPLPPSVPQDRRDHIMRHAGIRHSVSADDVQAGYDGDIRPAAVTPSTLAYIIYTSGSTGAPKGVMVEHRGIVNFIDAQTKAFDLSPESRYLFYLSVLFDAAISDIGVCLLSGAALVIEPADILRDGARLVKCLHDRGITHMDIPPSLLKTMQPEDMPESLDTIIIGGEACPPETVRRWAKKFRIVNVYGPTEATVCTSLCLCDAEAWQKSLIGDPVEGVSYAILDENMRAAEEGELYIGGLPLARGYLKDAALTDAKFIQHNGERLYKTGDKTRRLTDGSIEFLGRIDRQFKLRGQLVEPDEVEARLRALPDVAKAAVMKRDERLVAFLCLQSGAAIENIEAGLNRFLPEWMIPSHFEVMDALPLTGTGKTDYAALAALSLKPARPRLFVPPSDAVEENLWQLWREVLKHENFGVTDDFFAVGGDSLGVIRLSLLAERRGLPLAGAALAECRTIERLAREMGSTPNFVPAKWLKDDVKFDVAWKNLLKTAAARPFETQSAPRNIFLAGAAGFLGARLLCELLESTTADIYCLVRAKNAAAAYGRVLKAIDRFSIRIPAEKLQRIKPLCGDLAEDFFGLGENLWTELTGKIDAVYHCAAKVNMILPYAQLREANVVTTREVLRFCCTGRRKRLHHASTLSVFVATDKNNGMLKENDRLEQVNRVYGGYAQTKWAAEWMLLQVPQEACDIVHYRFGLITGDTQIGATADNDFLTMFMRGISTLGAVPKGFDEALEVDMTPIDHAAPAMAYLSLHGTKDIYHIANTRGATLGELVRAVSKRKGEITYLPAQRWKDVAENKSVTPEEISASLSLCRCLPEQYEQNRVMDLFQATDVRFDATLAEKDLRGSGLSCPAVTDELLDLYVAAAFEGEKTPLRICIFGPESTGKSTLAEKLAAHYGTSFASEYAKDLIFAQNGNITFEDIPRIARGQIKNEKEAARAASDVLFCDTDLVTTMIWSYKLFGDCPTWLRDAADLQRYDFYFLMDVDTDWVADTHRFLPNDRQSFLHICQQELQRRGVEYLMLSGSWDKKFDTATRMVDKLLGKFNNQRSNEKGAA